MKLFILKYWRNICGYIFIIIGVIFINKSFLFCMVEGISMQPTLNEKDYILVNKVNVCLSSFHHRDVVIIKRRRAYLLCETNYWIIGDNIQLKEDEVFINGKSVMSRIYI